MTTEEEIPNMEGRSLKESIPVLIELVKNLSNRLDALAADVRGLKEGKNELRIEKKDGIQENIVMQELGNEKEEQLNSTNRNSDEKSRISTDSEKSTVDENSVRTKMNWLISRGNLAKDTKTTVYLKKLKKLQYLGPIAKPGEHQQLRTLTRTPAILGGEVGHHELKEYEMNVKIYLNTMKVAEESRFSFVVSHVGPSDTSMLMEIQEAWDEYVSNYEGHEELGFLNLTDAVMILEYKHRVKEDVDQLLDELVSGKLSYIWKDAVAWVEAMKKHLNKFDDSLPAPGERLRIIVKACKSHSTKDIYVKLKENGYLSMEAGDVTLADVQNALNLAEDTAYTMNAIEEGQAKKKKLLDQRKSFRESETKRDSKRTLSNFGRPAPGKKDYRGNPNIVCDACSIKGHHAYSESCREYKNKGTEGWNSTVRRNKELRLAARRSADK